MTSHGFVSADALNAVVSDGSGFAFRFAVRVGRQSVYPTCRLVRLRTGKWWAYETWSDGGCGATLDKDDTDRLLRIASVCPKAGMWTPHFTYDGDGSARFHWTPFVRPTFRDATGFKDGAGVWRATDGFSTLYVGYGNRTWHLDGLPVTDPPPEYQHVAGSVRWLPARTSFAVVDGVARLTVTTTLPALARVTTKETT